MEPPTKFLSKARPVTKSLRRSGGLILVIVATDPDAAWSPPRGQPLPTTVIIIVVSAPPWSSDDKDSSMATHEMAVMKVMPVAGLAVPTWRTTGPSAHPRAGGHRGADMTGPTAAGMTDASAKGAASANMTAAAAMAMRDGKRGQQCDCQGQ